MKNMNLLMPSKNNLVLALKVALIVAAAFAIFYQDLTIVANDALQSEFMSHILAIPFLFGYLIFRKRKMIRASISYSSSSLHAHALPYEEITGTLLFLIAFLIYSYGSYTFTPLEFHMLALPIFVTAGIMILFTTRTLRQLIFPICFLFFLVPPPVEIIYTMGSSLSVISTQAACTILNSLGLAAKISTVYENPVITIIQPSGTTLSFAVDIACSGIYSLIGFLIFATFITYIARAEVWKKPAIFIIGLPLIYILNILRITIIVLLGYYHSMDLAMNTFHIFGGWALIFLSTLLLLVITEKALRIQLFTTKETIPCSQCNPITEKKRDFCSSCGRLLNYAEAKLNKIDLTKMTVLLISVVLIMSIQTPIFALAKGPADILTQLANGQQPTTKILPEINSYKLQFIYRDKQFEQEAKQDASLAYAYIPNNNSQNIVWVAIEIASARALLHSWEICLITIPLEQGRQTTVTQLDLRDVQLIENPPLIARYFAFQYKKDNITQVVLYWYEKSTFTTNTTTQQKYVKISLIEYPQDKESVQQAEDELLMFGTAIAGYWQPLKTWTHIALLISQNGNILTAFPTTALIFTVSFYVINKRKEKKTNTTAYKKLAQQDRKIIYAVKKTQQQTIPTLNNIASTYQRLNKETIDPETLLSKLEQARTINLVKREIASQRDEPTMVWKTRM
jgi:exosortase